MQSWHCIKCHKGIDCLTNQPTKTKDNHPLEGEGSTDFCHYYRGAVVPNPGSVSQHPGEISIQ